MLEFQLAGHTLQMLGAFHIVRDHSTHPRPEVWNDHIAELRLSGDLSQMTRRSQGLSGVCQEQTGVRFMKTLRAI